MDLLKNTDDEHLNNKGNSKIIMVKSTLLRGDPSSITKSIKSFDNIINAIQQVRIPQFTSDNQAQFWKETVISNLNSILIQEAHTRQTIRKCFSIICNLTQNASKLPTIFKAERVKFSQKRFPNALGQLIDNISTLEIIEIKATNKFYKQIETIFNIPGTGALDLLNQITIVEAQLKKCTREKEEIFADYESKQVNMEKLELLIEEQENQIFKKQFELHELNVKLCELEQVIKRLKISINASIRSKNTVRANYYKYLVKFKSSCIGKLTTAKTAKLNEISKLSTKLCKYKSKYEGEKSLSEDFDIHSSMMSYLQSKLDKLQKDAAKIEQQRFLFEKHQDKLGIKGDQYITFLFHLRHLARAIKHGCDAYAPIISSLNEIKCLIQCPIELITSEKESDVALGEQMLSQHAKHLWSYSRSMRQSITNYHHKRSWLIEFNNKFS